MLEILKHVDEVWDTPSPEYKSETKVALIDADSLLYYCMIEPTFEECKIKLDSFIIDILDKCETNRYAAIITPYDTFRRKLGVTKPYKGNRKGKTTPPVFHGLKAYAKQEWNFYLVEGLEADDCMGLYKQQEKELGLEFVICSPDKDVLKQVPGKHYNYSKQEWITTSEDDAWHFLWMQTLAGDSVDGIPGIPGIGAAKAAKILENVKKEDFPLRTLQSYMQKIKSEGLSYQSEVKDKIDKFKETLDLVYMLKDSSELSKYNIDLPELQIQNALDLWVEETQ